MLDELMLLVNTFDQEVTIQDNMYRPTMKRVTITDKNSLAARVIKEWLELNCISYKDYLPDAYQFGDFSVILEIYPLDLNL